VKRDKNLLAQLVLHMSLNSSQHKRLQNHVQPTKLTFVELAALVLRSILNILGKPLVELIMGVKKTGHDKVEQCPELCVKVSNC
jgi:hypothetical protein